MVQSNYVHVYIGEKLKRVLPFYCLGLVGVLKGWFIMRGLRKKREKAWNFVGVCECVSKDERVCCDNRKQGKAIG